MPLFCLIHIRYPWLFYPIMTYLLVGIAILVVGKLTKQDVTWRLVPVVPVVLVCWPYAAYLFVTTENPDKKS